MLSFTSDYALRAVLLLAQERTCRAIPADEIAFRTGAPRNYMAKTLGALAKVGVVSSTRGPQGGFSLSVPATELTLATVIDCFDEPRPQTRCMLGSTPCDADNPCAAHDGWTAVKIACRTPLLTTTVGDLLANRAI